MKSLLTKFISSLLAITLSTCLIPSIVYAEDNFGLPETFHESNTFGNAIPIDAGQWRQMEFPSNEDTKFYMVTDSSYDNEITKEDFYVGLNRFFSYLNINSIRTATTKSNDHLTCAYYKGYSFSNSSPYVYKDRYFITLVSFSTNDYTYPYTDEMIDHLDDSDISNTSSSNQGYNKIMHTDGSMYSDSRYAFSKFNEDETELDLEFVNISNNAEKPLLYYDSYYNTYYVNSYWTRDVINIATSTIDSSQFKNVCTNMGYKSGYAPTFGYGVFNCTFNQNPTLTSYGLSKYENINMPIYQYGRVLSGRYSPINSSPLNIMECVFSNCLFYTASDFSQTKALGYARLIQSRCYTDNAASTSKKYYTNYSDSENYVDAVNLETNSFTDPYFTSSYYNLSVSSNEYGTVNISEGTYAKDTVVELIATPNDNCKFVSWSDGVTTPNRSLVMNQNYNLVATFAAKIEYTITLHSEPDIAGHFEVNEVYYEGENAEFKAIPYKAYTFSHWSDGSEEATRSIEDLQEDKELTAYFVEGGESGKIDAGPIICIIMICAFLLMLKGF